MRSLRPEVGGDALAGVVAADRNPAPAEDVLDAIRALPPEHRAVIVLRYLLEYTPGEIARLLELPRGTVNSRLRRALDSLGGRLEEP
jgi:RNA polymerase sigma-70 factor (ECF subfamily)